MMKSLCESAGVARAKVFPHNLRHLFARTFYSIQKDIVRLADILGHSSVNTTRIYTMDKDKFFDISDNMMLTSSLAPVPIDLSGTYITADKNDGTSVYAFIGEASGVDKYSQLMTQSICALHSR